MRASSRRISLATNLRLQETRPKSKRLVEGKTISHARFRERAGSGGEIRGIRRGEERGKGCQILHIHNRGNPKFPNHPLVGTCEHMSLLTAFYDLSLGEAVSSHFFIAFSAGQKGCSSTNTCTVTSLSVYCRRGTSLAF